MQQNGMRVIGIGAVAAALGVSTSALRKWEKEGLIPTAPRLSGPDGDRVYTPTDLEALRLITAGKRRLRQTSTQAA